MLSLRNILAALLVLVGLSCVSLPATAQSYFVVECPACPVGNVNDVRYLDAATNALNDPALGIGPGAIIIIIPAGLDADEVSDQNTVAYRVEQYGTLRRLTPSQNPLIGATGGASGGDSGGGGGQGWTIIIRFGGTCVNAACDASGDVEVGDLQPL